MTLSTGSDRDVHRLCHASCTARLDIRCLSWENKAAGAGATNTRSDYDPARLPCTGRSQAAMSQLTSARPWTGA